MAKPPRKGKARSSDRDPVESRLRLHELRLNALERHVYSATLFRQASTPAPGGGLLEVSITITGAQESAASIDGIPVPLSGWTNATGTARVKNGKHTLRWHTKGPPTGEYNVALNGQTEKWDDDYHYNDQSDGHGNHEFEATE